MKKYPIKRVVVDIEALGGEVELTELSIRYREMCNQDRSFDTPRNALLDAGLTNEQIDLLGDGVANELMKELIDLTYPELRENMERLIASGEYEPPTEAQMEEAKKN